MYECGIQDGGTVSLPHFRPHCFVPGPDSATSYAVYLFILSYFVVNILWALRYLIREHETWNAYLFGKMAKTDVCNGFLTYANLEITLSLIFSTTFLITGLSLWC